MKWSTFKLGGVTLTHVEQDENSNQCVAAALAMICKNAGYSGHKFGEDVLFSQGKKAMKGNNSDPWEENISSKQFISKYGIKSNAVAQYLREYGFARVDEISETHDLIKNINEMANGDSAILACGVNQFHAFAAFKMNNTTYVLNPMPADENYLGCSYMENAKVVRLDHEAVFFNGPHSGSETFRSVDRAYMIPSQSYLGTVKRFYFG